MTHSYNFSRSPDGLTASFAAGSHAAAERETFTLLSGCAIGCRVMALRAGGSNGEISVLNQDDIHSLARRGFLQCVETMLKCNHMDHLCTMDRVEANTQYCTINFANGDWVEVTCFIGQDGSFCFEVLWQKDEHVGAEAHMHWVAAVNQFCSLAKELDV